MDTSQMDEPNATVNPVEAQEKHSISVSVDTDKPAAETTGAEQEEGNSVAWQGDPRYFQTGPRAGQMRPMYRRIGETAPREVSGADAAGKPSTDFDGIVSAAVHDARGPSAPAAAVAEKSAKEKKAEKKIIEAKIGAKMVLRMMDTLVGFISGGEYGRDFTPQQTKERLNYRAELEKDWQDFLATLDYSIHPGLVVAFGSMMYVAPAFETPKGKERTSKMKEKFLGKLVSKLLPF